MRQLRQDEVFYVLYDSRVCDEYNSGPVADFWSGTRYIVLILPLAFVFTRYLGANGVWYAFWLTEFFAAALSVVVYRRAIHDGCKKRIV